MQRRCICNPRVKEPKWSRIKKITYVSIHVNRYMLFVFLCYNRVAVVEST